jgi:hypothetical protein
MNRGIICVMDRFKSFIAIHKEKIITASSAVLAILIAAGILIAAKASTTTKTATIPTAMAKTEKYAESVLLNKNSVTLTQGQHDKLTATVKPTDAIDKTVQWSSSDKTVCTVSDGSVTAQGVGTAAVTATTLNGKSTVCTVTVCVPAQVNKTTTDRESNSGKEKSDASDASTGTSKANSGKKNDEDNSNSDDGQNKNSRDNTTINKTNKTIETKNNDQSQSSLTPPPNKEFYKTVSGCNIDYNPFYRIAQVFVDVTSINQILM